MVLISARKAATNVNMTTSAVPQSNSQLFSSNIVNMGAAVQAQTLNQIKNPNGLPMSNLFLQINVTDTTGNTTAPVTPTAANTALTSLIITGASGKQLLNIFPNVGDPLVHLQHRLNRNGYYNTAPTPGDTVTATAYPVSYNVLLNNWVIYPNEFPLTIQWTVNTLASRATTINLMTSTVQVIAYADFVPLKNALPKTVLRVKPVTGIAATLFDFQTYLDTNPIIDLSIDVGNADTLLSTTNSINVLVNNNPLVPQTTTYQNIINQENALYNITTPHITGFFPLNVLNGMRTLNPGVEKDDVELNFASVPNVGGINGVANLYMIETYT